MPRPGSHKYDIKRTRLRKRLENEGEAVDEGADREANRRLQENGDMAPARGSARTDRAEGPKGER